MNGELFDLALRGLWRRRRGHLLIFAVLFLSFAFAVVSLNVTGSMEATNEEYMRDTYGEWALGIPAGQDGDGEWLAAQPWLDTLGTTVSCGEISVSGAMGKSIGTADAGFLSVGRLSLQDGRFPGTAGEIAMEADLLSALGYDYTLGQEIGFTVLVPALGYVETERPGEPVREDMPVYLEKTYTLVGVIREYADIWERDHNCGDIPLQSALITEEAAAELRGAAEAEAARMLSPEDGVTGVEPVPLTTQYYMTVRPDMGEEAKDALTKRMESTRDAFETDTKPCENSVAFETNAETDVDGFYARLILAVTLLAVVCVYAVRLRDEARQLAIFRSVGVTRRQLCLIVLYETLLLGAPALLSGAAAGLGLTWAVLKTVVYSGSAPIRVAFPAKLLLTAALLWLLGVALARLMVFLAALRAPLTGRFYMSRRGVRRGRILRGALIGALSGLLGLAILFTYLGSLGPKSMMETWDSYPDYQVKGDGLIQKGPEAAIRDFPGVEHAWGFNQIEAGLSFEGMEDVPMVRAYQDQLDQLAGAMADRDAELREQGVVITGNPVRPEGMLDVHLMVVQPGDWVDSIDFKGSGVDMEEFISGRSVLINLTVDKVGRYYVSGYGEEGFDDCGLETGDQIRIALAGKGDAVAAVTARVGGFNRRTADMPYRTVSSLVEPYSVICSEAFLQRLMDAGEPGRLYANLYRSGEPYGYKRIFVFAGIDADYLSTDSVLAGYVAREGLRMSSDREKYGAFVRQWLQSLILVLAGGVCVTVVLVMLLWNVLSMEAEREKHTIAVLRAIGLSRRRLSWRAAREALLRGAGAAVLGWGAYLGYRWLDCAAEYKEELAQGGPGGSPWETFVSDMDTLFTSYFRPAVGIAVLTLAIIAAVAAISYLSKRRLLRGDLAARLREE